MVELFNERMNAQIFQRASVRQSGESYSLDRMRELVKYFGDPQDQLRVVHVAGTSGKTSTCYALTKLLGATGARVGTTVSPYVDSIAERVQIDSEPLDEVLFEAYLTEFLQDVDESGLRPTYFELLMALSFWVFWKEGVDYAVVEVGLGGLLDGTNICDRHDKICVITDIGLDHTEILGNTLEEIAAQKAGIIYDGNQVFMMHQGSVVEDVVSKCAQTHGANLSIIDQLLPGDRRETLPVFQRRNFDLALGVVNYVFERDSLRPLTDGEVDQVAKVFTVPGRFERIESGDIEAILDGAHNPQKLTALAESLRAEFGDKRFTTILGFGSNKVDTLDESLRIVLDVTDVLYLVEGFGGQDEPRDPIPTDIIGQKAVEAGFPQEAIHVFADPQMAVRAALADPGTMRILATGSFFLLHGARSAVVNR